MLVKWNKTCMPTTKFCCPTLDAHHCLIPQKVDRDRHNVMKEQKSCLFPSDVSSQKWWLKIHFFHLNMGSSQTQWCVHSDEKDTTLPSWHWLAFFPNLTLILQWPMAILPWSVVLSKKKECGVDLPHVTCNPHELATRPQKCDVEVLPLPRADSTIKTSQWPEPKLHSHSESPASPNQGQQQHPHESEWKIVESTPWKFSH